MYLIDDLKAWLRSKPRIRNPFSAPVVHVVYKASGLQGTYCYKCKLGSMNNRNKLMLELHEHYAAAGNPLGVVPNTNAVRIEIVEIF